MKIFALYDDLNKLIIQTEMLDTTTAKYAASALVREHSETLFGRGVHGKEDTELLLAAIEQSSNEDIPKLLREWDFVINIHEIRN